MTLEAPTLAAFCRHWRLFQGGGTCACQGTCWGTYINDLETSIYIGWSYNNYNQVIISFHTVEMKMCSIRLYLFIGFPVFRSSLKTNLPIRLRLRCRKLNLWLELFRKPSWKSVSILFQLFQFFDVSSLTRRTQSRCPNVWFEFQSRRWRHSSRDSPQPQCDEKYLSAKIK